jgi:hypothetical protein
MGDTRARSQGLNSSPDLRWVSLGSPVPDQTKPDITLPVSGLPRPNYAFAGSHPPNYEVTNDSRIPFFADLGCIQQP